MIKVSKGEYDGGMFTWECSIDGCDETLSLPAFGLTDALAVDMALQRGWALLDKSLVCTEHGTPVTEP